MTLRASLPAARFPAALLAVVIVTAAALAGCSASGTAGTSGASGSAGSRPASPSPVASSTGPADWWIRVNPCGLLTHAQLSFMGLPMPGQPMMGDGPGRANECEWGTASRNLSITLSAHPYTDLFFHTGRVAAIRFVDGRLGELDVDSDGTGGCQLTMQAVSGSSALVFATGRPDKPSPWTCHLARRVASLIRPLLPSP